MRFWKKEDQSAARVESPPAPPPATEPPAPQSALIGYLDSCEEGHFQGWAADREGLETPVDVELWVGDRMLRRVTASIPREDVVDAGYPGAHGFEFAFDPVDGNAGDELKLLIRRADDEEEEAGAPITMTAGQRAGIEAYMLIVSPLPAELAKTKNLVLVDVQDLVNFLLSHNSVTGIQRVVGGIIQVCLSGDSSPRFCMMGEEQGVVRIFDDADLAEIVGMAMAGSTPLEHLKKKVLYLKRRAIGYRPKADDTFFIGGAYWIVPDFGLRLNALKERGVIVGTYIYDLIPITAPQWVTDETRRGVAERAIDILLLSDFFLTISDFVKGEVETLLDFELGLSRPVIAAPLPHILPARTPGRAKIRKAMRDLGPFVLCVCTLEGRKNHMLLYRIWSALLRKHGATATPDLVLVGKWGWNIQSFQQACRSSNNLDHKIKQFDNVGDDELAYLYEHCMFTVFPSFVEGWGLPVGESLAAGKFCIASHASSIPEVGGDFCEYIDPHDVAGAYSVIEHVMMDPAYLEARTKAVVDGFQPRTWPAYVDNLLATIDTESGKLRQAPNGPLAAGLEPLVIYEITEDALVNDQICPWTSKAMKFSRASGWGPLESWGCWSTEREATLRVSIDASKRPMTLLLELRSAVVVPSGATIVLSDGATTSTALLETLPRWTSFVIDGAANIVSLSLRADFKALVEPHRKIYVGLSRIMLVEGDGTVLPRAALERLGISLGDRRAGSPP